MPTESELEQLMLLAESDPAAVFESVYKEFAGIVKQNVWLATTALCLAAGKLRTKSHLAA